jgi:hypothetical protein
VCLSINNRFAFVKDPAPLLLLHNPPLSPLKATSKNVIPAKAGIQKGLRLLDSRLLGSDKLIINRGPLKLRGDEGGLWANTCLPAGRGKQAGGRRSQK